MPCTECNLSPCPTQQLPKPPATISIFFVRVALRSDCAAMFIYDTLRHYSSVSLRCPVPLTGHIFARLNKKYNSMSICAGVGTVCRVSDACSYYLDLHRTFDEYVERNNKLLITEATFGFVRFGNRLVFTMVLWFLLTILRKNCLPLAAQTI